MADELEALIIAASINRWAGGLAGTGIPSNTSGQVVATSDGGVYAVGLLETWLPGSRRLRVERGQRRHLYAGDSVKYSSETSATVP